MNIQELNNYRVQMRAGKAPDNFSDHFYSHFGFIDGESNYMRNKREGEARETQQVIIKRDMHYDG